MVQSCTYSRCFSRFDDQGPGETVFITIQAIHHFCASSRLPFVLQYLPDDPVIAMASKNRHSVRTQV